MCSLCPIFSCAVSRMTQCHSSQSVLATLPPPLHTPPPQVELLGPDDLTAIASALHPTLPKALLARMVALLGAMDCAANGPATTGAGSTGSTTAGSTANDRLAAALRKKEGQQQQQGAGHAGGARFAAQGGPWEFNLRDLLRWADLTEGAVTAAAVAPAVTGDAMQVEGGGAEEERQRQQEQAQLEADLDAAAEHYAHMLFAQRVRTGPDRTRFAELFSSAWGRPPRDAAAEAPPLVISSGMALVGRARMARAGAAAPASSQQQQQQQGLLEEGGAEEDGDDVALQQTSEVAAPRAGGPGEAQQELALLTWQAPVLESMMCALSRGWMALLVSHWRRCELLLDAG